MKFLQISAAIAAFAALQSAAAQQAAQQPPQPQPSAPAAAQVPPLPPGVQPMPSVPTKPGQGLSPEEFARLLNMQMPLSPEQIRQTNRQQDAVERARSARVGPAPKPVSVTARITLDSGANPHVLRLDLDTVTSVVFTDVTGAPWKVLKVVAGSKDLLDIPNIQENGGPTNMFTVTPTKEIVNTNIAVFLEGAPAPVVMAVTTRQAEVDFRVDVSVQARGPAAVMPVLSRGLAESVPAELTAMVSGVTPPQARPLRVLSSEVLDVQAWSMGKRMYVRTRAGVLSPAVPKDGKVATGADGTKVYELPPASTVLLMQGGKVSQLKLGGFPAPPLLPQM